MIPFKTFAISCFLLTGVPGHTQVSPAALFRLDIRQYKEEGELYLGVSPEIRSDAPGVAGEAVRRFPRRFRYLLSRTSFQNKYEKYYPDTVLINQLYTDSLSKNRSFMNALNASLSPFLTPAMKRESFTLSELMKTAALFFYCEGINPDSSFRTFICLTMNGIEKDTKQDRFLLLQAFCFEAIFESYRDEHGATRSFVAEFKKLAAQAQLKFKGMAGNHQAYLQAAQQYCYAALEENISLQTALLAYYKNHLRDLGFTIDIR